ncbi:MAG: tungsten formylmethanofuran dehydrogenase [Hyphomicrobiales bacterium]|nr:tungsten formylmethanofuran dehydrogenase [Hyphomicrobiales bacterium]
MEQLERATAWIESEPAGFTDAAQLAANLLSHSRQAVFFGMGTDVAGARAAVSLAERIGAVFDHAHSGSLLRDLDCMREDGVMRTTPGEARLRADFVLLVGEDPSLEWPGLHARLLRPGARPGGHEADRRIVWLAPDAKARIAGFCGPIETIAAGEGAALAINLAVLRAAVKGRATESDGYQHLGRLAAELGSAKFGVAVWSARHIDVMALEMLNGLVRDLNGKTRFSTLPLPPPDNAVGVLEASGWMTGFPPRTGFGLGWPEHDPWRFDAERLLSCGEADCGLWISAFGSPLQIRPHAAPIIALCGQETVFAAPPRLRFAVGRPGVDHDATLHDPNVGALVAVAASAPSSALSVAATIEAIGGRLDRGYSLPC